MREFWAKGEVWAVLVSAIVLGVVFGFDDKRAVFEWSYWLGNVARMVLLSLALVIVYVAAQKAAAARRMTSTVVRVWGFRRTSFMKSGYMPKPVPLGVIVPVVLAFVSRGALLFGATSQTAVVQKQKHRVGMAHPWVTEWDTARIVVAGPLAVTVVALVARVLSSVLPVMHDLALMGTAIAISQMLPLPKLDGMSVVFGSAPLYVFALSFIVLALLFVRVMGAGAAVALALALALFILVVYYYKGR